MNWSKNTGKSYARKNVIFWNYGGKIATREENARTDPLEEIEERLVGYVTVLETEMIKRCGGKRENNPNREACVIYAGKIHQLFNFLSNFSGYGNMKI